MLARLLQSATACSQPLCANGKSYGMSSSSDATFVFSSLRIRPYRYAYLELARLNPQSYQTNVNGKSGFYSLAVLYIVFGVSALIAPAFVRAYPLKYVYSLLRCIILPSPRPVLIIAASTYVLFIGISAWGAYASPLSTFAHTCPGNLAPLLIAAVIIGIGASLLWTAQAVRWLLLRRFSLSLQTYVVRCSTEKNLGRNSGTVRSLTLLTHLLTPLCSSIAFGWLPVY